MRRTEKQLDEIFHVVISFLKDAPMTIVIFHENGGHRICKATHEQAGKHCATSAIFFGNTKDTIFYLLGMRDLLTDINPIL